MAQFRLSYLERIKRMLEEDMHELLPPAPTPRFRYAEDDGRLIGAYAEPGPPLVSADAV